MSCDEWIDKLTRTGWPEAAQALRTAVNLMNKYLAEAEDCRAEARSTIEPLTLKTEDGQFVKVELHPAQRAKWTEPSGAVATMVGKDDGSEMGIYRIVPEPQP